VFNFAAPETARVPTFNNSGLRFMLDILRANTKSTFTWLIVIGIVVVFAINFGPGSLSKGGGGGCAGGSQAYAARVNGKTIPAGEWNRQYRQLYMLYRQQAGDAFTPELAAQLQLPSQAMDQLVDHELVVQEAKRRGLTIGKEELTRAVHGMSAFQENGQFNFAQYEESARAMYGSAGKFEAALKDDLLYQKMMAAVRSTVKVSEAEVREAWEGDSDRVSLKFVRVPLAAAEAAVKAPTDAEVKAFEQKDAARIAKFHQENPARFDQKKKVRVRHLLAKVPEGGSDDGAKKKIADAQARLAKGEDFGKVAEALSDDAGSKARGGEIGFVSEGLFDDAFAKAALGLEKGQISQPVRSASGWHLLQAEEVVPAKSVPLDQAKDGIARELLMKDRALALARERAQAALDAARAGKPLTAVKVGSQTANPEETGPFGRSSAFVPKVGDAPGLLADAFAAKAGQALPKLYDSPSGPVVAVVEKRDTPDPKSFATQREAIETRLRNRKEAQEQGGWMKALRAQARIETNPQLLAAAASGRGSPEE
jgi:peptidyl-prolyl cis-trans isomerase D